MTISGVSEGTAGEELQLTCTVSVGNHQSVSPSVQWSGSGVTESETVINGTTGVRTLTFSNLNTSHGAEYSCQADINIPDIDVIRTGRASEDVIV